MSRYFKIRLKNFKDPREMSIGRDELADWLKALRDFVDHYNPHLLYFHSPTTENQKTKKRKRMKEREKER